jgi:hypothetical protein
MNIIHVDWHTNHSMWHERKYMPIIAHVLLHHPATTCIEIVALVRQVRVVREATVHDLEAIVNILESKLVEHVKEFPGKEINDAVPQSLSIFKFDHVFYVKRQPVVLLVCDVPDATHMVLRSPQ